MRGHGEPFLDEEEVQGLGWAERRELTHLDGVWQRPLEPARDRRGEQHERGATLGHETHDHLPADLVDEMEVVGEQHDGPVRDPFLEVLGERDGTDLREIPVLGVSDVERAHQAVGDAVPRRLGQLGDDRPHRSPRTLRTDALRDPQDEGRVGTRRLVERLVDELERGARPHAGFARPTNAPRPSTTAANASSISVLREDSRSGRCSAAVRDVLSLL